MNKTNYVDALMGVNKFLEELIADKLDVNRLHIEVVTIYPQIVEEVEYDDEDDTYDTYYMVEYRTRYFNKEKQNFDYGEVETAYLCHTETISTGDFSDVIVTEEEFANIFDDGENA